MKILAYRKMTDRGFPGPVMDYFYITEYEGNPWVADINDESAEGWGDAFEWDDEPTGHGIRQEDIEEYLKDADEIGYIEDKVLHITKQWKVPMGYGYDKNMRPMVTSWDTAGKDSNLAKDEDEQE